MSKLKDDGSVPLADFKREQFAMHLAAPMDSYDAYVKAGYTPDRKNAKRMAAREDVRARVRFLMAPAMRSAGISRERIIKEFAAIAFSDIRNVVKWGSIAQEGPEDPETGIPTVAHFNDVAFVNSDSLSDEAAAAVAEVKRSAEGAISIKLHPKIPALSRLAEILRMLAPPEDKKDGDTSSVVNLTQNVFNMTPQQAMDEVEAAFRSARQHAEPIDVVEAPADRTDDGGSAADP